MERQDSEGGAAGWDAGWMGGLSLFGRVQCTPLPSSAGCAPVLRPASTSIRVWENGRLQRAHHQQRTRQRLLRAQPPALPATQPPTHRLARPTGPHQGREHARPESPADAAQQQQAAGVGSGLAVASRLVPLRSEGEAARVRGRRSRFSSSHAPWHPPRTRLSGTEYLMSRKVSAMGLKGSATASEPQSSAPALVAGPLPAPAAASSRPTVLPLGEAPLACALSSPSAAASALMAMSDPLLVVAAPAAAAGTAASPPPPLISWRCCREAWVVNSVSLRAAGEWQ